MGLLVSPAISAGRSGGAPSCGLPGQLAEVVFTTEAGSPASALWVTWSSRSRPAR